MNRTCNALNWESIKNTWTVPLNVSLELKLWRMKGQRGEEGKPQQFLVRATSKFSSFSLIMMFICRTSFMEIFLFFHKFKNWLKKCCILFLPKCHEIWKKISVRVGHLQNRNIGRTTIARWLSQKMRRMRLGRDIIVVSRSLLEQQSCKLYQDFLN